MGKLECTVCGGIIECSTFAEAVDSLDHGIGLTKGRPCPNDGKHLIWNGKPVNPANPPHDKSLKEAATTHTITTSFKTADTATWTTKTQGKLKPSKSKKNH